MYLNHTTASRSTALLRIALVSAILAVGSPALADSCWDHNGSLMRLKAKGNQRWFFYEQPKATLANKRLQRMLVTSRR